ncbi:NADH-quinone oxidoreductase subunit NuoE family protein [Desulfobacula toluolica]|uniref:NuoE: NADH-quinone oxidoreductase, subunit E n=1 Tax=Desulfobacula toluolica (strain DSM 7467 / Tol2) TaxID=651182 RepID=K0NI66_DESTT|nr:NAD(P)H-dependent oxidoreductase subunit E [Desulfobacula toluolica]CCK81046.1 NuoE: NADH-quinone oxidoreductase, subunit E [Desulfobacula toluolica Tol2]
MNLERYHCHEDITEIMWEKIDIIIETYKNTPGAVITVLRECQNIVGYLPCELIDHIAAGMNLPGSEIFGVASFYSLFSLTPKGRHTIKVCTGTACYVKGIRESVSRIENEYNLKEGQTTDDQRFSLECVRCLGACGLAPVMVVGDDTHGDIAAENVIKILDDYK